MSREKTLCVIQARMGSTRLPGKTLADLGGISILGLMLKRLSKSQRIDRVVVATSELEEDNPIAKFCGDLGVDVFRGAPLDVLARFHGVAKMYLSATTFVRLTADCPFVDAALVDEMIQNLEKQGLHYTANRLPPPWHRNSPTGLDVECFTRVGLDAAVANSSKEYEREHVTPYMYRNLDDQSVKIFDFPTDLSHVRLTVDTEEDLETVRLIYSKMENDFVIWEQIVEIHARIFSSGAPNQNSPQKNLEAIDGEWRIQET